jgi:hypothetical protein
MDGPNPIDPKKLLIKADDQIAMGRFSNFAQVGSTQDAFILDFAFVQGKTGWMLSRVVLSPQHARRFHDALAETIAKYEERYGPIEPAPRLQ